MNIPTAEEFVRDYELSPTGYIEFAKLHVEAAESRELVTYQESVVTEQSILNAYPLTNIQ